MQFFVFAGSQTPQGGWRDFVGAFNEKKDAIDKARTLKEAWWEVIDTALLESVADSSHDWTRV